MNTTNKATVQIPQDTEATETVFGKRWGGQIIKLTNDDLKELQAGNAIALDVMNEYIVYLQIESSNK